MRSISTRFRVWLALPMMFVFMPSSRASDAVSSNPAPAQTVETVTFDCGNGVAAFSVVATYYFIPGRRTPVKVTATVDGKESDLVHERDDASGWLFTSADIWIMRLGSNVHVGRGGKTSDCVTHAASSQ